MSDFAREQRLRQVREMEALLPRAEAELRRFPNVVSVTVGAKEVGGAATTRPAFQVYVSVKRPLVELSPAERIPAEVLGFPTDVILMEEVSPTADEDGYRPLAGGTQLQQSGAGTLGLIALATAGSRAPLGAAVILTNSHVAPNEGSLVGQPSAPSDCWCSACCDVGRVVHSIITATVDAAIATLNPGQRFTHEIVEVGAVRGSASATAMAPGDPVFKRGRTTGLREGRFSTATSAFPRGSHNFVNQIRVTSTPGGPPFQLRGDSGSVLLDAQHRVIGLMHSAVLPAGTPADASRIEDVMSALNISIPSMGTAGAVPLTGAPEERDRPDLAERLSALAARYRSRGEGPRYWRLVQQHRDEVVRLVRSHRETKLAWQRCQGPAFLAQYLKAVKEDTYSAVEEIQGMRIENLLLGMTAVLQRHGSPTLSRDVSRHYLRVLEASRGCRRVEAFLDRITAS